MSIWEGIEEFVTVVECGTFSAAARRLGVSTSFVSRQISGLEERMGTQLVKRTTRKMNLTAEGEAYFQRCAELMNGVREANTLLMEGQTTPRGLIRITAAGLFAERQLAPLLADFMEIYPEVQIEVDFNPRNMDMIEGGFDLAIRYGTLKDSTLTARKLTSRRLSICGSPSYFEKHGHPKTPSELKDHNCLVGNTNHWRLKFPDGIREIAVEGRWHCNSGIALVEVACRGLGLTYLPEYFTKEKLDSGELLTTLDDYAVPDMATWLVYPNRQFLPTKTRLLIDFITNCFNPKEIVD